MVEWETEPVTVTVTGADVTFEVLLPKDDS